MGRIVVCAIGLGVAVAGAKAGLEAYQRGSLPRIPDLMAATTKAIVESLPNTPAAASGTQPSVSGPAVPDSAPALIAASDSVSAAGIAPMAPANPNDSGAPAAGSIAAPMATGPASAPAAVPPGVTVTPAALPASTILPAAPPVASASIPPIVAAGRTELAGGMFAVRAGDTVTVHFDTPEARTRRPEKFEQIVRATLPAVHGSAAQRLLASIAPGSLIGAIDLVNELPTRGLHLRGSDGRSLSLWPETRPGRDGPLVVAYRATPSR